MRRIVLHYTTGPLAGLRQIWGTDAEVPTLPSQVDAIQQLGGRSASLVKVEERYALYREIINTP